MSATMLRSLADVASYLANANANVAGHLDATAIAGDPPRVRWTRGESTSAVEIFWDEIRRVLWIRAPLRVDASRFHPRDLAGAVAQINVTLEVLGVEHDGELAFVSHLFFDGDGAVSKTGLDRLLVAVDECEARAANALAALREISEDGR